MCYDLKAAALEPGPCANVVKQLQLATLTCGPAHCSRQQHRPPSFVSFLSGHSSSDSGECLDVPNRLIHDNGGDG